MNDNYVSIIAATITAVLGGFIGWLTNKKKTDASISTELNATAMASAMQMIDQLQEENTRNRMKIEQLEKTIEDMRREMAECEQRYLRLEAQMEARELAEKGKNENA
jgi:TolA-binding protein